jgi:hypothetical protein
MSTRCNSDKAHFNQIIKSKVRMNRMNQNPGYPLAGDQMFQTEGRSLVSLVRLVYLVYLVSLGLRSPVGSSLDP